MEEHESTLKDNELIKQKIRDRYRGVDEDLLDVIPAAPQEDFYKSEAKKRVAVYARVSTDDPNQTSSYELQKNHYEDLVNRHPGWDLVDIYADEGISGTSLQHRDSFVRMISDCKAGKIDLIVTKSVSRFARNIIDCIGYVRELKAADPPVGVFFETENIYTLDKNSEMSLSFIATLAQEESHTKSEIMNSSIEMRFKRGIFLTPVLLGYDHDDDGNLIINEDEANTVRLIFFSYLYGYSAQQIADALTDLARTTKAGNQSWTAGSVLQILSNERYCGDVLARKTFTPNYLTHKSKRNNHDRNQYRQKNHHEAIISHEDFFAVQKMIRNAKYGNKGYFPEMHVVTSGFLQGFVTVHPKWAGFTTDDYFLASNSICDEVSKIPSNPIELIANKGDLDLSGYELVRSQFMTSYGMPSVLVSSRHLQFNRTSIEKMAGTPKVEMLVHPHRRTIAIRKAATNTRNALDWCKRQSDDFSPKHISGGAFLPTLYQLFRWKENTNYAITGSVLRDGDETVLVFNASDAVILLPEEAVFEGQTGTTINGKKSRKRVKAFPSQWVDSFGEKYYQSKALYTPDPAKEQWKLSSSQTVFQTEGDGVTSPKEAAKQIKSILYQIGIQDE